MASVPERWALADQPRAVVHVRSSGGVFGADRVVLDLCLGLPGAGYEPILVPLCEEDGSGRRLAQEATGAGLAVEPLELSYPYDLGAARRLAAIARRRGALILHSHDYKSDFLSWLGAGRLKRVTTLHGQVGTSWALRCKEALGLWLVRRFDRVVCVSKALGEAERRRGSGNSVVVHNGIDVEPFARSEDRTVLAGELGIDPELPTVGAIGRLSAEKGFDTLLEAFGSLCAAGRRLQLVLIGDGPERAALAVSARRLGIGAACHLAGHRDDARRFYNIFDVFCMASRREGLPLALLEALAAERAVVATPVGGIPEVLGEDGAFARLVPPDEPAALAAAIGALLDDPGERARLGQRGRGRVVEAFSRQAMAAGLAEVYDELLQSRKRNRC